ncbi:MAG: helix-turn-helix transcriptional regulator [Bacteroidia bacterium]|nr:helix-turn-helix transcriptional regulator [Bacteroidia bacterium]
MPTSPLNLLVYAPDKKSLIDFSSISEISSPLKFRNFSIKYVSNGCEEYTVNGNKYSVTNGQYLLANHSAEGAVEIDSRVPVSGICIDLSHDLLSEVTASYRRPDTFHPDPALDKFFKGNDFLENKYASDETILGQYLRKIDKEFTTGQLSAGEFTNEFYFNLAENIIADHIPVYRQLQNIPSVKSVTRKDLLRRINSGKAYLDANYLNTIDVNDAAVYCCLSEYHFYRLFRKVFGITPYQYVIRKRLDYAKNKLLIDHVAISEVALLAGFSDVSAFSKSFRKQFGYAPSSLNGSFLS